jgi:N-acetylglucosamine kinase-like BadF-type ATPase
VSYYLGIDGGGSKTACAVGDDSAILATATSGPSNIVRVGEAQARESLHQCVRQACAAAGIKPEQIAHTCIGAAGAARPEIASMVREAVTEILSSPIDVVGDIQIALEAAFDAGPGVIVIAGTGSIAYGRDQQGNTARAGGRGFAISDEGSAHWIGRAAISAVLRAHDRMENDSAKAELPLLKALMKSWGVSSLADLTRAANAIPPPDFAALFPAALVSSESGDELARSVLSQAGRELAELGALVIGRLFAESFVVPLAMAGGVFRHAALVREVFYNQVRERHPHIDMREQVVDPVEGALRLARRQCGAGTPFDKLRADSVRRF